MPQKRYNQSGFLKKRTNSLNDKRKPDSRTPKPQRPGVKKIEPKPGYEFLSDRSPVYNMGTLRQIRMMFAALWHAGVLRDTALELHGYRAIMEMEKICADTVSAFNEQQNSASISLHTGTFYRNLLPYETTSFKRFENQPYVSMHFETTLPTYGCFLLSKLYDRRDEIPWVWTGFALMEQFLDACTWEQMGFEDDIDGFMDYAAHDLVDEDTGEVTRSADFQNWRDSLGKVYLQNRGIEWQIQEIVQAEREWRAAHNNVIEHFHYVLKRLNINALDKRMQENDAIAAFLKGVVYLINKGFRVYNYYNHSHDRDEETAPPHQSFGFLWKSDAILDVIDENMMMQYQGGLGGLSFANYYFEDSAILLAEGNPIENMKVFTLLFCLDPVKNTFDYESKDINVRSYLASLHIHGWKGVLHRAISNFRKQLAKRVEAAK